MIGCACYLVTTMSSSPADLKELGPRSGPWKLLKGNARASMLWIALKGRSWVQSLSHTLPCEIRHERDPAVDHRTSITDTCPVQGSLGM